MSSIVLFVLLLFTDSDYPFDILRLVLQSNVVALCAKLSNILETIPKTR